MKRELKFNEHVKELSAEEMLNTSGGGDIIDTLKCISGTLTSGAGMVKTLVLGCTVWGMARMAGVAVGCAK